eukprot:4065247-Pleurochrysis_carterae.AAC.1
MLFGILTPDSARLKRREGSVQCVRQAASDRDSHLSRLQLCMLPRVVSQVVCHVSVNCPSAQATRRRFAKMCSARAEGPRHK